MFISQRSVFMFRFDVLRSPRIGVSPGQLRLAGVAILGALSIGLTGCGDNLTAVQSPLVQSGVMSGSVHGGQQPVSGATVALMAPGTGGYGSAASVIASTTTNASGGFTLPQPYTCPANSGLVYLLATGGNAGAGTNPLIAEAAIVGSCSGLSAATFVNVTEVTTVAAAYALAPFATVAAGSTGIGTSAGNLLGLANAAGAAGNLASFATGLARKTGDAAGIVPPTAEINTLANIISACVNQGTTMAPSGGCATLFAAATPAGGVPPTDTFQAAINIALHPGANTLALYNLMTPSAPFQPALTTAPPDFSVALGFNGGAITSGTGGAIGVAIDATGNAWITTGSANGVVHTLTEISPAGVYLSGSTVAATTGFGGSALTVPIGLAFDKNGFLYVANSSVNNVVKFNADGSPNTTFATGSLSGPNGISVDGAGDVWVADFSSGLNRVTEYLPNGTESTHSPYAVGFGNVDVAAGPLAIWATNYVSKGVSRIDASSFAVTNISMGFTTAGVAIDHANNAWIAVTGSGNVAEFNNAGTMLSPAFGFIYPNGGVQNITIDGLGRVFAGGYLGPGAMGGLVEFSNAGVLLSPDSGFSGSNVIPAIPQPPEGIHIDGSGNVWIAGTNGGTNNGVTLPNYVSEVIGIAAPVVTPRALAIANNTLGTRP